MLGFGIKELVGGNSQKAMGPLISGFMFCVIPTAMIFLFRAQQKRTEAAAQTQRADPTPWRRREDWAKGEIAGAENQLACGFFVAAAATIVLGVAFSGFFPGGGELSAFTGTINILFFGVPAVLMIVLGIRATSRQKKFGRSVFKMSSMPGVIGGGLEGKIEIGARLEPADGFTLRLRCFTGIGSGRNSRTRTLWENQQQVRFSASADDPTHSAIPVSLEIPAGCEETDSANPDNHIYWQLEARAAVPGVNYLARFEVPVFKIRPNPTAQPPAA